MALFGFKSRNPNRDRETDETRLKLLNGTMADLVGQIEREKEGLNARYGRVAADAAFSLQALENRNSKKMGVQVDELTRSMARSRSRLKALDAQLAFLHRLQSQIDDFVRTATPDRPA